MNDRIVTDISNYIFVSDSPEKVDAIFLPGGSHPKQPEYAAELYRRGYAKWLIPSGAVSVKRDKWPGVRSKADIYNGNYQHPLFLLVRYETPHTNCLQVFPSHSPLFLRF